jgi:hypothetical protein
MMKKHLKRYAICLAIQVVGILLVLFGFAWTGGNAITAICGIVGFLICIPQIPVVLALTWLLGILHVNADILGMIVPAPVAALICVLLWTTADDKEEMRELPNQASDATSEPAPGAASSSHQR